MTSGILQFTGISVGIKAYVCKTRRFTTFGSRNICGDSRALQH